MTSTMASTTTRRIRSRTTSAALATTTVPSPHRRMLARSNRTASPTSSSSSLMSTTTAICCCLAVLWLNTATISVVRANIVDFDRQQDVDDEAPPRFLDCDLDDYYLDGLDEEDPWMWKRRDVAALLTNTHRGTAKWPDEQAADEEVAGLVAGGRFGNDQHDDGKNDSVDVWQALADLDRGTRSGGTVRMMFTQTEVHNARELGGWQPGYLWPLASENNDEGSATTNSSSTIFFQNSDMDSSVVEEWKRARADLHNLRPRHPTLYDNQLNTFLYYGQCDECTVKGGGDIVEDIDLSGGSATTTDTYDRSRISSGGTRDGDSGSDTAYRGSNILVSTTTTAMTSDDALCTCMGENKLQPPAAARGEIARSLLYMELRYGDAAPTSLDLRLTDCSNYAGTSRVVSRMGYLSQLLEWHLVYPPTRAERDRNDRICAYYQGNRNPFVDFPHDSWALLDLDDERRRFCEDADDVVNSRVNDASIGTSTNNASDFSTDAFDPTGPFSCHELMPGDVNFFMVESGKPTGTVDGEIEVFTDDVFGIVTLVGLPEGLDLYVTDNAWTGTEFQKNEGTLRISVPENGMKPGAYFGYGDFMYLGDQWQVIEPNFSLHDGMLHGVPNEGDQLFLYCFDETSDEAYPYHIVAALSTTGRSFANAGQSFYWDFESALPSNLDEQGYGVIILPQDSRPSSSSGISIESAGGYRYTGPIFTHHDAYAKALINADNWEQLSLFPMNQGKGDGGFFAPGSGDLVLNPNGDQDESSLSAANMQSISIVGYAFLSVGAVEVLGAVWTAAAVFSGSL